MLPGPHLGSEQWPFPVWPMLAIILVTSTYLRGWFRLRSHSENPIPIPLWQASSFLLGLTMIWFAGGSPLAALDMELLTAHMIQHLLLMTFAPPLILLGVPSVVLANGIPRQFSRRLATLLGQPSLRWFCRTLAQPAFCWFAAAATLIAWHIPALFALTMHSEALHALEQFSFFATGLLFWWPVVRHVGGVATQSGWVMLLYLFLATIPCDILSAFLVFSERVVYPVYFSMPRRFGFSVLADQQCAGGLMWTCVTIVYLVPATILAVKLLSSPALGTARVTRAAPE